MVFTPIRALSGEGKEGRGGITSVLCLLQHAPNLQPFVPFEATDGILPLSTRLHRKEWAEYVLARFLRLFLSWFGLVR